MIAIIDYGMGNIHSVQKAIQSLGKDTKVVNNPKDLLKDASAIVLPGVGAFDDAMAELKRKGLIAAIKECIINKKNFLGICLGMQILLEKSEEAEEETGLGILKGKVKRFSSKTGLKVPHMGWNQLKVKNKNCPLLKDVVDNSYVYFCHSYYPLVSDKNIIAATCDYGIDFSAVIWQDNIYGVQFHPEKSQSIGLKILKNFIELK
jgi:glutamine amidotransferase